jgi:hypothetical protein
MKIVSLLAAGGLFVVSAMGAFAADRRVEIVNKTGMTMTEFYASNTSASDWKRTSSASTCWRTATPSR